MTNIVRAFIKSIKSFCHPKIALYLISSNVLRCNYMVCNSFYILGLFYAIIEYFFIDIFGLTDNDGAAWVSFGFTAFAVILILALFSRFFNCVYFSLIFLMPIVLKHLVQTDYQQIEK